MMPQHFKRTPERQVRCDYEGCEQPVTASDVYGQWCDEHVGICPECGEKNCPGEVDLEP